MDYKCEENEFLASFSQNINVQNEYNSCHCSSNCIRNEIVILKSKIERIDEKLDAILQKMNTNIIKNCDKMGEHIDFVNNVYDTVKVPLHYISNKVQKMIGGTTNENENIMKKNIIMNNPEYIKKNENTDNTDNTNDDEYLFTECD